MYLYDDMTELRHDLTELRHEVTDIRLDLTDFRSDVRGSFFLFGLFGAFMAFGADLRASQMEARIAKETAAMKEEAANVKKTMSRNFYITTSLSTLSVLVVAIPVIVNLLNR